MSELDAWSSTAELRELLAALREEILTDAQKPRLEQLLADEKLLDLYVRYTALHADLHQFLGGGSRADPGSRFPGVDAAMPLKPPPNMLGDEDENCAATEQALGTDLTDAVFGYRIRPTEDTSVPEEVVVLPMSLPRTPGPLPHWILQAMARFRPWLVYGSIAAMVLIAAGVWRWHSQSAPPEMLATLDATVDAAWEGSDGDAPVIGSALAQGQSVRLTGGCAEFTYRTGAQVILQGPAQARLDSRNRLVLDWGRVTATVPEPAHGFTVVTPAGEVVDLGTEFGIDVTSDQVANVVVFRGHVKASAAHDAGDMLTLAAGEAAQINSSGVVLDPAGGSPAAFIRDIHQVTAAFAVHGTGQGLPPGSVDPHWTLNLKSADDAHGQVLSSVDRSYVPGSAGAQWISVSSKKQNYGHRWYTFTTTFDLTGFNPATARLKLGLAADNYLSGVQLNGASMNFGLPNGPRPKDFDHKLNVTLDNGFVPGLNQLQIVVLCVGGTPMALLAEVSGTAVKLADDAAAKTTRPAQ